MKLKIFLFILLLSHNILAQDTLSISSMFENYVLKVKILDSLIADKPKFDCGKKLHTLYSIDILDVFYIRDSSVYKNTNEILKVKYLLIKKSDKLLERHKEYYITAGNTVDSRFLYLLKSSDKNIVFLPPSKYSTYQSGLVEPCLKLNFFQRVISITKSKKGKERKYQKMRQKYLKKDTFFKYLENHN